MKVCNGCGKEKPESDFAKRWVGGKQYLRTRCRKCESKRRSTRTYGSDAQARASRRYNQKLRDMRSRNEDVPRWILQDSRRSDRKRGTENDLTKEFIAALIADGCRYCGETDLRMTLDRVDNERGHTKDNVVPACIRCNYVRGNMPHKAWVEVSKGMTAAREKGLFGEWQGRAK